MMDDDNNFEVEIKKEEKSNEGKSIEQNSSSDDYRDNNDEDNNNNMNINDSLNIYEKKNDKKDTNLLGSEEIFINQKKEIEIMKKRNEILYLKKESKSNSLANTKNYFNSKTNKSNNNINDIEKEEESKEKPFNGFISISNDNMCDIQTFTLNDYKNFEYTILNNEGGDDGEKSQLLNINNIEWKTLNEEFPFIEYEGEKDNSKKYLEINNTAIRVVQEIDYDERGLELNIKFNLLEQSEFWVFTRCLVNKEINESYLFDEKSENIDINDYFNKYTSLIKIIKHENLNRYFITFGTFYHETNDNNKLYYKSFLKRQLIDYSQSDNYNINNLNETKSEFNMIINDFGEELINVQIYLNNDIKPNNVNGNFFLPINKKAKILILGRGKSVQLKEFEAKTFDKRNNDLKMTIKFESENETPKNCECCNIM